MSEELKQKWLNWLDQCADLGMTHEYAIRIMKEWGHMSANECTELVIRWLDER